MPSDSFIETSHQTQLTIHTDWSLFSAVLSFMSITYDGRYESFAKNLVSTSEVELNTDTSDSSKLQAPKCQLSLTLLIKSN